MSWNAVRLWCADHPQLVDGLVAATMLALGLVSVRVTQAAVAQAGLPGGGRLAPAGWVAYVALIAGLAVRRRWPLTVTVVGGAAFAAFRLLGGVEGVVSTVAVFLAIHAAGAYGRPRARDVVRAAVVLGLMGTLLRGLALADSAPGTSLLLIQAFSIGLNVFFLAAAWVFGDLSRIRTEREQQLATRTAELEVERERNAARAVVDERVRIARELHDVLAHHVSVMGVQAGAARRMLDRAPDRAAAPLAAIEESARSAVLELQRMLSFLRRDDEAVDPVGRAPQPGLGQVARLVDDVRHAGVAVDLRTDGDLDGLPDTVHLSAYRIVQEALTNVLKHAGAPVQAAVAIVRDGDAVTVEVVDDGHGPGFTDQVGGTGSGLVGMRERVLLHGGQLVAGPRPGGGFHVRARLPVAERRAAPVAST